MRGFSTKPESSTDLSELGFYFHDKELFSEKWLFTLLMGATLLYYTWLLMFYTQE